jgi:hypothetical protein
MLFAVLLCATPAVAVAQATLLAGGGFTSPVSDFKDVADPGYHLSLGAEVGIPSIPVGLRLDGSYHRLPEPSSTFVAPRVLAGALSVIFELPGEGIEPYFLFGVGRYRVEAGPVALARPVYDRGFQTGFGVSLGGLALGAFAEIRWVQVGGTTDVKYIPVTVGIRL